MAKETAEKKLLKLIESTESQDAEALQSSAPISAEVEQTLKSVKSVGISSVSLPPVFQNLIDILKGLLPLPAKSAAGVRTEAFGLKQINQILVIVIFLVSITVFFSVTRGMKHANRAMDFSVTALDSDASGIVFPGLPDLAEYLARMTERNIFHPYEAKVVVEDLPPEEIKVKQLAEKTAELKLVGISWLDTPESASALIENVSSGVTHFLRAGEKINGIQIKQIYADSVTIGFDGEEMEMKL